MKKKHLWLPILITIIIFSQSLLSGDLSGAQSGRIVIFVSEILQVFGISLPFDTLSVIIRKSAHFFEYFLLGCAWMFVFFNKSYVKIGVKYALIISFLTALIDETIQIFVPGRVGSIIDVMIDMAGAITGILLLLILKDRR